MLLTGIACCSVNRYSYKRKERYFFWEHPVSCHLQESTSLCHCSLVSRPLCIEECKAFWNQLQLATSHRHQITCSAMEVISLLVSILISSLPSWFSSPKDMSLVVSETDTSISLCRTLLAMEIWTIGVVEHGKMLMTVSRSVSKPGASFVHLTLVQ